MTDEAAPPSPTLSTRTVVWLGVVAALVAYLPTLADGFVFDDLQLIEKNPYAQDTAYLGRCFTTDLLDTPDRPVATGWVRFYRPLVCVSYNLNYWLGGGAPWSFHAVNTALHAAATALVARMAVRLSGGTWPGLLVTLAFALHPTRTENVTWVSGRTDVLMAVFLLAAHELAVAAARRTRPWPALLGAVVLWVAAVLSKEFAVCWPLLLLMELPDAREPRQRRRLIGATAASLVLAGVYLLVRTRTMPIRPPEVEGMGLPPLLHAGYVLLSIGYYAERVVLPWPQTMHFRPVPTDHGVVMLHASSVVVGAVVTTLLLVWLFRAARRDRGVAAALVAFGVVLLPVVNVSYTGFPGTTADRFLYVPLLPLAIAAARQLRAPIERWTRHRVAVLATGLACLPWLGVTWIRHLDYLSDEALWTHELEVNPDDPKALSGLCQAHLERGELDEASALLRRALSPSSARFGLLANPARYYVGLVQIQALRLADADVDGLEALLVEELWLADGGRHPHPGPRRAGDLTLVPPLDEHFATYALNAAATLRASAAVVASRLGHDSLARALATQLGAAAPLDPAARYNLALALGRAGDTQGAAAQLALGEARSADPSYAAAAAGLRARLAALESLRAAAPAEADAAARLAEGHAMLELGAYLRAARSLRLAHAASPEDPVVGAEYLDALVSARLDGPAEELARRLGGPVEGLRRLAEARAHLSPRTAKALAPADPGAWWVERPGPALLPP